MKQGVRDTRRGAWPVALMEVAAALGGLGVVSVFAAAWLGLPGRAGWAAAGVLLAVAALALSRWPDLRTTLGPANRVTLGRAVLVAMVAGALVVPAWVQQHALWVALVAGVALALDGVNGWVARRCRCASAFGARFDMELDAFLILVLCVHLLSMGKAGHWVLAIGAMRYAFVAAMRVWPWLDAPLPERGRRKLVCVAGRQPAVVPVAAGGCAHRGAAARAGVGAAGGFVRGRCALVVLAPRTWRAGGSKLRCKCLA